MVGDAVRDQIPMQPEPVATSFITTDHRGIARHAKPLLGSPDLVVEPRDRTGRQITHPRALSDADGKSHFPPPLAQLEREQQTRRRRQGRLTRKGHGLHRYAPSLLTTTESVTTMPLPTCAS